MRDKYEPIYAIGGGLHFPITQGRGSKAGIEFQQILGTGKQPWQKIGMQELMHTIDIIESVNPKKVFISASVIFSCKHNFLFSHMHSLPLEQETFYILEILFVVCLIMGNGSGLAQVSPVGIPPGTYKIAAQSRAFIPSFCLDYALDVPFPDTELTEIASEKKGSLVITEGIGQMLSYPCRRLLIRVCYHYAEP